MSGPYYYLVASLPTLDLEKPAPFSYEAFVEDCQRLTSAKDFAVLIKALLSFDEASSAHPALTVLAEFNRRLRNEMARVRAKTFHKDPSDYMRGDRYVDQECVDVISQAFKADNPLGAEKILDLYKWKRFEELGQNHFFDLHTIIAYGLKLQILERQKSFASDKGLKMFKAYDESEAFKELLANL